jgi:cation diffusion facilitator CzcD-associated flavoprotein CzcO
LETNIDASVMEFSQEPIPHEQSATSVARHGPDTPFRPWQTIQRYIESLVNRNGYQDLVSFNTTVERVTKVNGEWEVVLRKTGEKLDYWWKEYFDAVVVANGHYTVPYVPAIEGLAEFEKSSPGSVIHTKAYRGRNAYRGKVRHTVVSGSRVDNSSRGSLL